MEKTVNVLFDKINRQAHPQLYRSSFANTSVKNRSKGISIDNAVYDFRSRLEEMKKMHKVGDYTTSELVGQCFGRTKRLKTETERTTYCRSHFALALLCFDNLIKDMRHGSKTISHTILKRYAEIIVDYLFDLKAIIEHLEQRHNLHYVFFEGSSSQTPMTWQIFRLSQQLALQSTFKGSTFHMDHMVTQIASTFVLRQALETKFSRLVGVGFYNSLYASPRLDHSFHYNFIKDNLAAFRSQNVNFALLRKIYDWCNEIVHHAFRPYIWQNAYAHLICRDLFRPVATPPGAAWSINNAVEINDVLAMQSKFIRHFFDSYKDSVHKDVIWCIITWEPEAVES